MKTVLACVLILAALPVSMAAAGLDAMPTRIDLARFTCADLLGLDAARQERALVYLTGVMDGRRRTAGFDAEVAGKAIDRLLGVCRATPSVIVVDAFTAAWP
jgi:HdeA/HdeB family